MFNKKFEKTFLLTMLHINNITINTSVSEKWQSSSGCEIFFTTAQSQQYSQDKSVRTSYNITKDFQDVYMDMSAFSTWNGIFKLRKTNYGWKKNISVFTVSNLKTTYENQFTIYTNPIEALGGSYLIDDAKLTVIE